MVKGSHRLLLPQTQQGRLIRETEEASESRALTAKPRAGRHGKQSKGCHGSWPRLSL